MEKLQGPRGRFMDALFLILMFLAGISILLLQGQNLLRQWSHWQEQRESSGKGVHQARFVQTIQPQSGMKLQPVGTDNDQGDDCALRYQEAMKFRLGDGLKKDTALAVQMLSGLASQNYAK